MASVQAQSTIHLPRVEIKFCVQCKWNLRAAYYAQELLQTFSNDIGEIALVPVTGGVFTVTLYHIPDQEANTAQSTTSTSSSTSSTTGTETPQTENTNPVTQLTVTATQVWDRKADSGFPETKELKNRIRNLIDPKRDMGHIDRSLKKSQPAPSTQAPRESSTEKPKPDPVITTSVTPSSSSPQHTHTTDEKARGKGVDDCEECNAPPGSTSNTQAEFPPQPAPTEAPSSPTPAPASMASIDDETSNSEMDRTEELVYRGRK